MVRSLFQNSDRKLRSTFWGSPFIPVGTNQTECFLPLTNFSVPSRFQTHATQIRPFLDSIRNGCGISTVNWQVAYHYAFDTPTGFFCQMVSTQEVPVIENQFYSKPYYQLVCTLVHLILLISVSKPVIADGSDVSHKVSRIPWLYFSSFGVVLLPRTLIQLWSLISSLKRPLDVIGRLTRGKTKWKREVNNLS